MMKKLEQGFERLLWDSRLVVLAAVVTSLLAALAMFYIATVDAVYMFSHLLEYASPALDVVERSEMRSTTITHVVEVVDGYLLATVLLIFALGLYELFISKIEAAEQSESASNVLLINSLDDLKNRLAKVILMILVVKFFEHAIGMRFNSPMDLLVLAGGISLVSLALYLSHAGEHKKADGSH
jgi:uncharacterized membrane protein YqhA